MKLTRISMAVAGLCAVATAPSFALTANLYTNTGEFTGDTMNIRASGATAVDPGFFASALRLCLTGGVNTIHRYSISNNSVLFCNTDTTKLTPRAGTTKLAVYKFSQGGSGGGVQNVNNATSIPFINLSTILANCATPTVTAAQDLDGTNPLPSFVDTLCTGAFNNTFNTANAVSYIGISDVEPQFFGNAAGFNNLKSEALNSVIFGIPVTKNIFEILQAQQGKTVGALDEANMPSLSQAQLTSMYTQEGQTWSALLGTATGLADDTVYVARRVSTSGTQKSFEAVVAKTPNTTLTAARQCYVGTDLFVTGAGAAANAADNTQANTQCSGGSIVVNNSGSNQVITCMNKHQADGRAAVGVLSTEFKQTLGGSLRFVKANGVAPTYSGVASGQYQYYTDVSLNTRIGATLPTASALGYAAYLTAFKNGFADPATIEVINGSNQTFGPSGLMALDVVATPVPVADYTGATARNPWSRLVGGSDLNNCQSGKAAAF
jgi:hypothetical protein